VRCTKTRGSESPVPCRVLAADELAGIFIFTLCFCDQLQMDPETIVLEKLKRNSLRYPVGGDAGDSSVVSNK
jgi:hypothetical protein